MANSPDIAEPSIEDHFKGGLYEASADAGVMFSPFIATGNRPTVNYQMTELVLGYMLTDVHGSCFWRGNVEAAGSVFGGPIFEGKGSYVAGGTLWLRYNFVPTASRFVPYLQAGAGLTGTDVDSRLEGIDFNFNLNLGAGTRYFFSPNWCVNLEYRYQHISNANISDHNLGVNACGPMLGVSFFF